MNKYYLRSIREDGFGECVLAAYQSQAQFDIENPHGSYDRYLSSLPVSALAHPDLAAKIKSGWVENAEEEKYAYYRPDDWRPCTDKVYEKRAKSQRRILLVEKKQEEKSEAGKRESSDLVQDEYWGQVRDEVAEENNRHGYSIDFPLARLKSKFNISRKQ